MAIFDPRITMGHLRHVTNDVPENLDDNLSVPDYCGFVTRLYHTPALQDRLEELAVQEAVDRAQADDRERPVPPCVGAAKQSRNYRRSREPWWG